MRTRVAAQITGRVQGVGFRPVVYRYATQFGLGGFVRNGPGGVALEVEGEPRQVGAFFEQLASEPPHQAVIAGIRTEVLPLKGYDAFSVLASTADGAAGFPIPPDLATCDACLEELADPTDRRYRYPFINCTNCGPRFTIIDDLPYDRARTSMAGFTMCAPCDREFHDPADRRFHAQPDACPDCGPTLSLLEHQTAARPGRSGPGPATPDALRRAVALLRAGRIVAVKSLGGYHLACDATQAAAVAELRQRKHRPSKPLAVMFRDLATLRGFCAVSESEEAELLSAARPIVVLPARAGGREEYGRDPRTPALLDSISPDSETIGAFLPYTPLHHLLLESFAALVMTSGNRADEPIISTEAELPLLLGPIADAALTHDRPILHKCDDSVLRVVNGQRAFLRRARGYVPSPIRLAASSRPVLAAGGELKNTFCLVRDGQAFVSQHLGDLKQYGTYQYYDRELRAWQRLLQIEPQVIAHDLHPGYWSTRWAKQQRDASPAHPPVLIPVQHHHAHIASVLAEHELAGPVIGVALDGTGYGPDGTIWGGEFLAATRGGFERVAHFKQYPMPGGEAAVREPARMAASVLLAEGAMLRRKATIVANVRHIVAPLIAARFNCPLTSSAGRLFDAVAALVGFDALVSYEAQAAIKLEQAADPRVTDAYGFTLRDAAGPWILDFGDTIRALLRDQEQGVDVGTMAGRFQNTVVAGVVAVCARLREARELSVVALSGGVWQNAWLLARVTAALRRERFRVYTNTLVPANDGGLSLGQAAVAAAGEQNGETGKAVPSTSTSRNTSARGQPCV